MNKNIFLGVLVALITLTAFSFANAAVTITNVSPVAAGETWSATKTISWNAAGTDANSRFKVEYRIGTGSWNLIVDNLPSTTSSYNWNTLSLADGDNYQIKVTETASDPDVDSVSQSFKIFNNDAPVFTAPSGTSLTDATVGVKYEYTLAATDADNDTLTYSVDSTKVTPAIASLTFDPATKKIACTPDMGDIGSHTVEIKVNDNHGLTNSITTKTVTLNVKGYVQIESDGVSFDDKTGADDEINPGDELEFSVDVKNIHLSKEAKDVQVTVKNSNIDISEKSDKVDIAEEDSDTFKVTVKIPTDAPSGNQDIEISVKGEVDNVEYKDSTTYKITIEKNSHDAMIESIVFDPEEGVCGGSAKLTLKVTNIGSSDENGVYVNIKNTALKIDVDSSKYDLDEGDDQTYELSFDIPSDAENKEYEFDITVYDEDNSQIKTGTARLTINGCESSSALTITDTSESVKKGAVAEFDMTVKNSASSTKKYTLKVSNMDWATYEFAPEIKDSSLSAGKSINSILKITPKSSATAKTYTAIVTLESDGKEVATEDITVEVTESGGVVVTGHATDGIRGDVVLGFGIVGVCIVIAAFLLIFFKKPVAPVQKK